MPYPNADDLITLCAEAGLTEPETGEAETKIAIAIAWWEQETGYRPFFSPDEAEAITQHYDPPGPRQPGGMLGGGRTLRLRGGFVTVTHVRLGITSTDAAGELQVAGEDYDLLPYEAREDAIDEPYTMIRFRRPLWGDPKSISVTGVAGYCTALKATVTRAIVVYAGYLYCMDQLQALSSNATSVQDDEAKESRSIELLQKFGRPWLNEANRALMKHKRIF